MAGKNRYDLPADAANYSEQDWLVYGDTATPNTRQKLIALTIEEMVVNGPGAFNVKRVCDRIDAKYGLVNYYFGSKDVLVAEASALSYKKSVLASQARIISAPRDAEKRLRAHLLGELEWFRHMNAWGILVSYPILSVESRKLLETNFGKELQKYFELYTALMSLMLLDLRKGTISDFDFDIDNIPRALLTKHPVAVLDATSIMWNAHGLNVWSAGKQLGSSELRTEKISQKIAIEHHINRLIEFAKKN